MKFRRTVGGLAALATASSAALMSFAAPASAGSVTGPGFTKGSDHSAVSLLKGSDGQVTGIEPEGSPLALPQKLLATLSSTTQIATAQLDRHLSPFGVKASDMKVTRSTEVGNGSAVRYQQYKDGVKVFGGQLVTSIDKSGRLQSILGHTATGAFKQASDPIRELKGALRAKKYVAKKSDTKLSGLDVKTEGHRVYNPSVVGAPGPDANIDAYEYTVTDQSGAQNWTVLVNRQLGGVLLGFNQTSHALNRDVCDRNNQEGTLDDAICDGSTNEYVRTEGQDASGIKDVDAVYENLGKVAQTYAAYANLDVTAFIGSNSGGDGKALRATTRVCASDVQPGCPMGNAFWTAGKNGQMVYGEGYTVLDVTGHELSHGVTEHTSGLLNLYQSGSLNESNSDIWGEIIDQFHNPNKPDDQKWLLGDEMASGFLRDMADPSQSKNPQPDKMTSSNWLSGPEDQGGVHINDGVGNKTGYLIAAGDSFNGYDVKGLGLAKTAKIYWTVNNLLTSGSDYKDLFHALPLACQKNIGAEGTYITKDDCKQVDAAVRATEMYKDPNSDQPVNSPYCDPGAEVDASYSQGFDKAPSDWTLNGGAGPTTELGINYVNSGKDSLLLFTQSGNVDSASATSDPLDVKAGSMLRVDLATFFDMAAPNTSDDISGMLQYSTDGGSSWNDAADLPGAANGGPWTGHSSGWSSAKYDLSSLAGQSVEFRFSVSGVSSQAGAPASTLSLDNFKIYTCS